MILGKAISAALAALTVFVIPAIGDNTTDSLWSKGLAVTFYSLDGSPADHTVRENFSLYVPKGTPPTPFLSSGPFEAVWRGAFHLDLRDRYIFQAELNGKLTLELNGAVVLDVQSNGEKSRPSGRIRLRKHANALKAMFTAPEQGDAFFRLYWSTRDYGFEPLPPNALRHDPSQAGMATGALLRQGRQWVAELRCFKCHEEFPKSGMAELAMDAPSLSGIGSRRSPDWMARWILEPSVMRPETRMPGVLHGSAAPGDARAIAAFLATLKTNVPSVLLDISREYVDAGKQLFDDLHCIACHHAPGTEKPVTEKLNLNHIRFKFGPDSGSTLSDFLQNPSRHHRWTRMPDFNLSRENAEQLAAYLFAMTNSAESEDSAGRGNLFKHGRELVQTVGCLNCHPLEIENKFSVPRLTGDWSGGCLGEGKGKAPRFNLDEQIRAALKAFGKTGMDSLRRHVPAEFAIRQTRLLNCRGCHDGVMGVPPFQFLGGKIKPEWMTQLIDGKPGHHSRPWLRARMPAFPARATQIAQGLAMLNGLPPFTPGEGLVDPEAARVGLQLISAKGGFFCASCHGVNQLRPAQGVEAEGINLAIVAARLQPEYFRRWMSNPLRINPQTKMPAYFYRGQSALLEIYDGDAEKQIGALWQCIRLGEKIPAPTLPGQ